MANVVDALTVTLTLDASGFTKGQREAFESLKKTEAEASRTAKSMQAEGVRASEFFSAAKIEALALLGVLTGGAGLIAGFQQVASGLVAVNRAAILSGETTQFIQNLSAAVARTGGDGEAATQQLIAFNNEVAKFQLMGGSSPLARYSPILDISPLTAKPHEVIEGIMRMIERNGTSEQGRRASRVAMNELGVSPGLQASLLQIGSLAGLHAALQRSIELGVQQSETQMKAAQRFYGSVETFKQVIDAFVKAAIPFQAMADALDRFVNGILHFNDPSKPANPGVSLKRQGEGDARTGIGWWDWIRGNDLRGGAPGGVEPGLVPSGVGPRADGSGSLTAAQRQWANAIAGGEAPDYNIRYGERAGRGTLDINGPHPGMDRTGHSAAGKYQFIQSTWLEAIGALGLPNVMSPANQDAAFAYLLRKHGVTDAMLSDPARRGEVLERLRGEWPSLPGGSQQNTTMDQLNRRLGDGGASPLGPRRMLRPEDMMAPNIAPMGGNTSSTETHIGAVNVYPPNGDSKSIAQSIKQELAREILNSTNTGMV